MRSEKEVMDIILNTAKEDPRIRAVYMGGSRNNPNVPKDKYQDYDIGYVVTETEPFIKDKNWIKRFGDIAVIQEPDKNNVSLGMKMDFSKSYGYLMLFKDGTRIDLGIAVLEAALEDYKGECLTTLLLDKDNVMPSIPKASDRDYIIKKPTEGAFIACCNEFWWCLNNVGKGIGRDELSYAMWMFNIPVRDMFMRMMEWYIGINTDFKVSAGKMGKFFKRLLPEEIYERFTKTYAGGDYESFWNAIDEMCSLFRETACEVAMHCDYKYNTEEDENMTIYLSEIKEGRYK